MAPSLHVPLEQHLTHLSYSNTLTLGLAFIVVPSLFLLYQAVAAIYAIYFDSLSHLPGQKSWIAFPVLQRIYAVFGNVDKVVMSLHARYGPVVRVSKNEVSFTTKRAWDDIYGYKTIPQLPKPLRRDPTKAFNIINANDADHTRFRKALSHGFSERALKGQEAIITSYVDLLIERLQGVARGGQPTNMVRWYNYTTFDIIGDLTLGESFNCLNSSEYHHWVLNVINLIQNAPYFRGMLEYPWTFKTLALLFADKQIRGSRDRQESLVTERLTKRINNESQKGRWDFVDSMMKHQGDEDEIRFDEMVETTNILILAGSETTATLLSGVTYYLCRTPSAYEKLKDEVRSKFKTEDEINFTSVMECEYMLAVLEEGLRMFPPAPSTFSRQAIDDMVIDGVSVPKGAHVGVHQLSTYRARDSWSRPYDFVPERWLKEGKEGEFRDDDRDVLQPFHVGPRNCIGRNLALAEMRLILAKVMWNFDLELLPKSNNWTDQKIKVLWIKPELMCKVKVRDGLRKAG